MNSGRHNPAPSCCTWLILVVLRRAVAPAAASTSVRCSNACDTDRMGATCTSVGRSHALSRWWETFGDAQLTSLVRRGIAGNLDVRTAISRLREARASVPSARASLRPTVDGSGLGRVAVCPTMRVRASRAAWYSLGLDASWKLTSSVASGAGSMRRRRRPRRAGRIGGRARQPDG